MSENLNIFSWAHHRLAMRYKQMVGIRPAVRTRLLCRSLFMSWLLFMSGLLLISGMLLTPVASAAEVQYKVEKVWSGLGIPWAMQFLDKDVLLVSERSGRMLRLDLEAGFGVTVKGLPDIAVQGQGGLLDLHVRASDDEPWVYFTYSAEDDEGQLYTALSRARIKGQAEPELYDLSVLIKSRSSGSTGRHFGSRIMFDNAGMLYVTIGDRGKRQNGQALDNHAGSILRLNPDGSVPEDNPFVSESGALAEIWSYGHRNPQGISYDPVRDQIWAIEHGPRGGDELNLIRKGRNYGWPVISYGKEYWGPLSVGEGTHKEGMEQPEKYYVPSIAPGSLLLYTGTAFPQWQGDLFAGALKLRHLNHIQRDEQGAIVGEKRLLSELNERIRSVIQGPEGKIWVSTDGGNIYRIEPGV